MANLYQLMPYLEGEELVYVQNAVKGMNETQLQQFAAIYSARRRDPLLILLTGFGGFLGVAGIQRFLVGHVGLGILFFITLGFCFIGTIIDLVNHKRLAFEYNQRVVNDAMMMVRSAT